MDSARRRNAIQWRSKHWRIAPVMACAAAALLLSACLGGSSGGQNSSHSSPEYGKYSGSGGGNSLTISFKAAPSGIEQLKGFTLVTCSETNGNGDRYGVNSTIPLQSGGKFSSDTTFHYSSGVKGELKVNGSLDDSGHASGTLRYKLGGVCDSGVVQWTASLAGSSPSPASGGSCSPQPCGTNNGVSVSVRSLDSFVPNPGGPTPWIEVTFTVTNHTSSPFVLAEDSFGLQPGNGSTVPDHSPNGFQPVLSDGSTCDPGYTDLQPRATSSPLHACVPLTAAQSAGPLKFIWAISTQGPVAQGAIDLSSMTIGTHG